MYEIFFYVVWGLLALLIALWIYFWIWKPVKKWRAIFLENAALLLARLRDEGLDQKVAELLILSFWRTEPHKQLRELLETYAGRSMEEVYASYGLPQA